MCPKVDEPAKRVLDCGTGTGIWAMEYGERGEGDLLFLYFPIRMMRLTKSAADAHPEAKVTCTHLALPCPCLQPRLVNKSMRRSSESI